MVRIKRRFDRAKQSTYLYKFLYQILVHCPRCNKCAQVILHDNSRGEGETGKARSTHWTNVMFGTRRLVCTHCGFTKDWQRNTVGGRPLEDGYFHQPLWLQTPCCGETLWAYNAEHLSFLEEYVGAGLRESGITGNSTHISRLPLWIKSAKNRDEVLRCIRKLRETL